MAAKSTQKPMLTGYCLRKAKKLWKVKVLESKINERKIKREVTFQYAFGWVASLSKMLFEYNEI